MVIDTDTCRTDIDVSICPDCGNEYERLGTHFSYNEDHRPDLSELQRGVIDYLILRGATVRSSGNYPAIEVYNTDRELLRAYSDLLGWLSNSVRLYQDSDTVADGLNDRLDGDVSANDCNDVWALSTVPHPAFENYTEGSTDVENLRDDCLKATLLAAGTFVGDLFGSLHIDLRGWDIDSDRFAAMLAERGYSTVEYDGDGYATDTFAKRYHHHNDVLVIEHYDAMELLDAVDLPLKAVAEPI